MDTGIRSLDGHDERYYRRRWFRPGRETTAPRRRREAPCDEREGKTASKPEPEEAGFVVSTVGLIRGTTDAEHPTARCKPSKLTSQAFFHLPTGPPYAAL